MLPPTYLTCLDLARHADPDAVLADASQRQVEMFCPELEPEDDGYTLTRPPHADALLESRATAARWGKR